MAQNTPATWTVMVYLAADNDLEVFALEDLNEMELVGSTGAVNLVVQLDRAEGFYASSDDDWTDTRRYRVAQDLRFSSIGSAVVSTLGETNHGDPDTLVAFVTWAMRTYPAEHYALILWNHGAGWSGFGSDFSADSDGLSLAELDSALNAIHADTGAAFDLIGFDACLMGQLDVLHVLAPYADYAVVSEETEPGNGWDYVAFLDMLVQNPAADGEALGRAIIDSFMAFYTEQVTIYNRFGLSLIDLQQVAAVETALEHFAAAAGANPDAVLSAIGDARRNVQTFGGSTTPDEADIYSSADLIHFLHLLERLSPEAPLAHAASDLRGAVERLVIYHRANDGLPEARGLAVYFPRNPRIYRIYGTRYPEQVTSISSWQSFLSTFYGTALDALPPATTPVVTITGTAPEGSFNIHHPPILLFTLDGQDIVNLTFSATLFADDGRQIMFDLSPLEPRVTLPTGETIVDFPDGVTENEYAWMAEMPVITDGTVAVETLLLYSSAAEISVRGTYLPQHGDPVTAYVTFDPDSRTALAVWATAEGGDLNTAPYEIRPEPGDQFLPTWRTLDDAGDTVFAPADSDPLTFGDQPFSYEMWPAHSGTYELALTAEDVAGQRYADRVRMTIDNEGRDPAYRGFTDANYGLSFMYPWDWLPPYVVQGNDGATRLLLPSRDGNVNVLVTAYDTDSLPAMTRLALNYAAGLPEGVSGEVIDAQAGKYPATLVDYTFFYQGMTHTGTLVAVVVPETAMGYLIQIDALQDAESRGQDMLRALLESVMFFEPL